MRAPPHNSMSELNNVPCPKITTANGEELLASCSRRRECTVRTCFRSLDARSRTVSSGSRLRMVTSPRPAFSTTFSLAACHQHSSSFSKLSAHVLCATRCLHCSSRMLFGLPTSPMVMSCSLTRSSTSTFGVNNSAFSTFGASNACSAPVSVCMARVSGLVTQWLLNGLYPRLRSWVPAEIACFLPRSVKGASGVPLVAMVGFALNVDSP
mmetsp:Transcript_303/g.896  ORF Transcript_303/g.896 Transcript_303/m.896 type:complete len:210 (+) Transcript_303:67-696(+)